MEYKKPTKKDASPKVQCQNKKCLRMGRYQSMNNFYKSRNEGILHHPYCKECVNLTIDIDNLQTVYDVLQFLNTPFIMDLWNEVILSECVDPFGNYFKLLEKRKTQYENLRWKDSIFELTDKNQVLAEQVKSGLDEVPVWSDKWQGEYTPKQLQYLNDYFTDLQNDFKIVTRNHKDYAMKIAQASLAMNEAFNDMQQNGTKDASDKYRLASATFDSLSKSAQFAESQRGANDVSLGCFGKVFDAVEKHTWIPEYVPEDKDMYDKLLEQFANINKSL